MTARRFRRAFLWGEYGDWRTDGFIVGVGYKF
ncbi:Ail/Lom family outer membrane beta-barrel protein [Escherichia coli]